LNAFLKALAQLPDRRFLAVVAMGAAGALVTLLCLWAIVGWALATVAWGDIWLLGNVINWLGGYADDLGWFSFVLGAGGLTWLLFPATATAITGLFLDSICNAVEADHYPGLRPVRGLPLVQAVGQSARFLATTVALNLLVLPFYLILFFVLGTGAFLFIALNGYLVGREFFELVASRRLPPRIVTSMRRAHRFRLWLFGMIGVFFMSLPFVNLIAPVITAAAAVHLYQRLSRKEEFEAMTDGER
jgi:uncharacterized protein involved in cysteine biosynthesis